MMKQKIKKEYENSYPNPRFPLLCAAAIIVMSVWGLVKLIQFILNF